MRVGLAAGLVCLAALGQGAPAVKVVPVPPLPGTIAPAKAKQEPPAAAAKLSNPAAAEMVYQAGLALQRNDPAEAQKQLDAARALNPEELRLASTYGYLQLARGDKPGAEEDFKKELALHPQATEIYGALAELQGILGQRAEEEQTLRQLFKTDPRMVNAPARLVHMLVEDGKAAEAVKLGQDAAAKFTENLAANSRLNARAGDALQSELSKAEYAAGLKAESLATTLALLKVTASPQLLNVGAYRLAVEGVELPLAEKSARLALVQVEADSRKVSFDTKPELTKAVLNGVVALWDTLGLVLYREGKLDDAEGYARSSWLQRQNLTVGAHLADIEAAKGDKNLALTVCEVSLAEAGRAKLAAAKEVKPGDAKAAEVKPVPQPGEVDEAAMQSRADALRKAGAISKGQAALSAMLTLPAAPLRGVSGTGEFKLMMQFGIVQLAAPETKNYPTGMLSEMLGMKVSGLWPKNSGARLIMTGSLSCRPAGCALTVKDLD